MILLPPRARYKLPAHGARGDEEKHYRMKPRSETLSNGAGIMTDLSKAAARLRATVTAQANFRQEFKLLLEELEVSTASGQREVFDTVAELAADGTTVTESDVSNLAYRLETL